MLELQHIQKIYFLGIGGIGMSALARYFHARGAQVWGYDRTRTALTDTLTQEGMHIHYEADSGHIPEEIDLAVYTPAIPPDHVVLRYLQQQDILLMKRAEVLGLISRNSRTLAVAGTHGKTTTSSMLAWLLKSNGVDATAFLGGIAHNFGSNYVAGHDEWVVIEADEFDRSFLHLHPEAAAILSIDADHLDVYGSAESVWQTGYQPFAQRVKEHLVVRHDLADRFVERPLYTFGIECGQLSARRIGVADGWFVFDLTTPQGQWEGVRLPLPGAHNVLNALAALSLAQYAGVPFEKAIAALATFKGVWRRFDWCHRGTRYVYIDDYAHHPAELEEVIGAARALFAERRITVVFQPHLYTRTRDFLAGFAQALSKADEVVLLDIYPAREMPIPGVSADLLAQTISGVPVTRVVKEEVVDLLAQKELEVLLTLGAGDIDQLRAPIAQMLRAREVQQTVGGGV